LRWSLETYYKPKVRLRTFLVLCIIAAEGMCPHAKLTFSRNWKDELWG
jgi:hypothetical protein